MALGGSGELLIDAGVHDVDRCAVGGLGAAADELEGLRKCYFGSQSKKETHHVNSIATNTRAFGSEGLKRWQKNRTYAVRS